MGCNCGRHLNALYADGYKNLTGLDVNPKCEKIMGENFPELKENIDLVWKPFEEFLPGVKDDEYDIVYTHGATIEYISPGFNAYEHISRISKKYIILANITYSTTKHPRFWLYGFQKYGFTLVKLLQPEKEWSPDSKTNRPVSLAVFQKY